MGAAEENGQVRGDALGAVLGLGTTLNSLWMRFTYPFAEFGRGVSVDHSCDIRRSAAPEIQLGDDVYLAPGVWIDIAPDSPGSEPKVVIGSGCAIGRRSTISARNQIILEADVLLAPSVLIMDHGLEFSNHGFSNIEKPVHVAGSTSGGRIFIGRNCWLGIGAVISCTSGELNLGRNSVVGANAVVTCSFPPFSLIAGNPAKLVKTYDQETGKWVRTMDKTVCETVGKAVSKTL
jgi:acetyltransferase-like isoleucine patch superfamily enzyme